MNQSSDVIKFGKFKGTALVDLKHSYVRWLLTLENLDLALGDKLRSLPWVQEEAERERKFQKRKAKAELFSKPCFQRRPYSHNQRIAYNNAKFNS
ncbi:hypothetical protein I6M74_08175 [Acinetobacter bereziniae]|uniref:hypothetical protein n=1 Tax=Acinetobacter bereziniae TaxID=106648 RepID=UPI0018FF6647|nr:hypothetical protein [Acinetobacter bereziniae]MBJ8421875.1 hypothetical protein [Acinetobacter bereziniae]